MPVINPQILRWARETAGLSLEEAARRINLRDARGIPGANRLAALEKGDGNPSPALLRRIAKQYRRPLLTFFLPRVPRDSDVGQDFRTLPARGDPGNTLLKTLLRDIKARQSLVREILEDDEDAGPLAFIGSQRQVDGVAQVAEALARDIRFNRAEFRDCNTIEAAFNCLREKAENVGVFVVLAGNLGNWQTAINVDVFRGFAIADELAPFVVINDQDARSAWAFTLLHELTHLWLGVTGVSGATPTPGVERFCNDVAAAILVDRVELRALPLNDQTDPNQAARLISAFAQDRKVSRSMIAYQLFRSGQIGEERWRQLTDRFHEQWVAMRAQQREANREAEGGPNYYVVRRHRIGSALLGLVRRGLGDGTVSPVRAGKILGVKPMAVYPLMAGAQRAGNAS